MRITSFHIDSFGKLANVNVDTVPAGLSVFLGKNEAGKSTCLEFFRAMLTGLPAGKAKKLYTPITKAYPFGGFMTLTSSQYGAVRVARHLVGSKEHVSITDVQGNSLAHIRPEDLVCGISREVFRNVFGFSLTELQLFASLNGEAVREALYGASFGMGLRSPGDVINALAKTKDALFRPKGSSLPLNDAFIQWKKLQEELTHVRIQCETYDALHMQEKELHLEKDEVREQRKRCESDIHKAEQQLSAWKLWEEWHKIENTLERLEDVVDAFPENGVIRLEQAQKERQQALLAVQKQEERCKNLEQDIAACAVDSVLLQRRADLQALSERKSAVRHAQAAIAPLESALQRCEVDLAEQLANLGTGWTCQRIRETNRSLFARDALEKIVTNIQTTEQMQVATAAALEKANATVTHMEHNLAQANAVLAEVPQPVAALDDMGREQMRRHLAAIEHAQKNIEEKYTSGRNAQQNFDRAMLHVHLYDVDKPVAGRLEQLLQVQEQAMGIAAHVHKTREETQKAEQALAQAAEAEEITRARMDRTKQHRQYNDSVSRPHIDIRTKAVRSLRHLHNVFSVEKERHDELQNRVESSTAPAPVKSIFLLIAGILIILCGFAGVLLPEFASITEVRVTSNITIPLSKWSSYFIIIAGAAFLAGGMPRTGPERKLYEQQLQDMKERLRSSGLRLIELEGQIQEQCVIAEIQDADPVTLDAVELRLETAREQCATDERVLMEIQLMEEELEDVVRRARQKREILLQRQNEEQQALRSWHDLLTTHDVQNVPSPDAAGTFFARVEAALLAHQNVHNSRMEMHTLEMKIVEHRLHLAKVPPVAELLAHSAPSEKLPSLSQSWSENTPQSTSRDDMGIPLTLLTDDEATSLAMLQKTPKSAASSSAALPPSLEVVIHAANTVLGKCRVADAAQAERHKAEAAVNNAQQNLDMALHAQKEAAQSVHETEQKFLSAHASWTNSLKELSIPLDISPGLLHVTLDCMERCLHIESEMVRMKEEKDAYMRECNALKHPLMKILRECGRAEEMLLHDAVQVSANMAESLSDDMLHDGDHDGADDENHVCEADSYKDWLHTLDILLFEAQAAQEMARQHEQYKRELTVHEEDLHVASSALRDATVREEALVRQGQAKDSEDFLRLAAIHMQRKDLNQRKADLKDALTLAARGTDFDDFLQSFAKTDEFERRIFINTKEKDLEELIAREQECVNALAGISAELRALTTSDHVAQLRQQESNLQESIKNMSKDWCRTTLARHLLLLAKERFEDERQPEVIRTASHIFKSITAGRWDGLAASLEKNSLHVIPPHSHPVDLEVLSRGTQEQLYLALRLAYIRHHAKEHMALPIIMDDVLVNFDPERSEQTARALLQLTQEHDTLGHEAEGHQIFFFTCHPYMADMLQDICPQSQRYIVEDGAISTS